MKRLDPISKRIHAHYSETFKAHGPSTMGISFGSKQERQLQRYFNILKIIRDPKQSFSLLDVGCGYGGLYAYAKEKGYKIKYTGIDLVETMITWARRHNTKASFIHGNFMKNKLPGSYDYIVCNGSLNIKGDAPIKKMDIYVRQMIRKMFQLAQKGVVFNMMSNQVDFMSESLFYKSPVETLSFCLHELTSQVILDHTHPLYEYTVYLYKT